MRICKSLFSLCLFLLWVTAPSAADTTGAPDAATAAATVGGSKKCLAATRKVDREQRALSAAVDAIAKDKKGRESCSTKGMCSRYDAAIDSMEKRKARHETRLTRFKEDADSTCKQG
jgi:hypothetical protein